MVMGELIGLSTTASLGLGTGSSLVCLLVLALYAFLTAGRENNDDDDSSPGGGLMQPIS
jgi:hypothetical protein